MTQRKEIAKHRNVNTNDIGVKGFMCGLLFPRKTTRKTPRKGKGWHHRNKQREGMASFIMECMGL